MWSSSHGYQKPVSTAWRPRDPSPACRWSPGPRDHSPWVCSSHLLQKHLSQTWLKIEDCELQNLNAGVKKTAGHAKKQQELYDQLWAVKFSWLKHMYMCKYIYIKHLLLFHFFGEQIYVIPSGLRIFKTFPPSSSWVPQLFSHQLRRDRSPQRILHSGHLFDWQLWGNISSSGLIPCKSPCMGWHAAVLFWKGSRCLQR